MSKKEKGRTVSDVVRTVQLEEVEAKSSEVAAWIESKLKEKLKKGLRESLVDGVVLCKLANAIKPNCIQKYHRQPRLLMMKMENIGFFLTTCKSRFQVPSAMLFQPTDLHDDADVASMRKVLNVLIFIKHEVCGEGSGTVPSYVSGEEDEDEEETTPSDPAPTTSAPAGKDEPPEIDDDEDEPEPAKPEPVKPKAAEPAKTTTKAAEPAKTTTKAAEPAKTTAAPSKTANGSSDQEVDWYLTNGKPQVDPIQQDVVQAILESIHQELSLTSKIKLLESLLHHIDAVENKVINATDDDLHNLVGQMGLGKNNSNIPTGKSREWYLDFIFKYGRLQ